MKNPNRLTPKTAKVGMRVIMYDEEDVERFRGIITNIGKDRMGAQPGMSVRRDDFLTGSGVEHSWFCCLNEDNTYYSGGDSRESYFLPEFTRWRNTLK